MPFSSSLPYIGPVSYTHLDVYKRQQQRQANAAQAAKTAPKQNTAGNQPKVESKLASKLSFKEQKVLDEIPAQLEQLETEQSNINAQLADSELYKTQATLVKTLQTRLVEIESELENLLAQWEALEAKKS